MKYSSKDVNCVKCRESSFKGNKLAKEDIYQCKSQNRESTCNDRRESIAKKRMTLLLLPTLVI